MVLWYQVLRILTARTHFPTHKHTINFTGIYHYFYVLLVYYIILFYQLILPGDS